MAQQNKEKKTRNFRLTLSDDKSHKHLWTAHFTKVGFIVTIISAIVMFSAAVYCVIAYTPVRTFIPGYPDAHSKRAALIRLSILRGSLPSTTLLRFSE